MTNGAQLKWLFVVCAVSSGCGHRGQRSAIAADADSLRTLAGLWCTYSDTPVAADGRVDVYALVRQRMKDARPPSRQSIVSALSSERIGFGPEWDQIRNNDYSKFPWGRFRGVPLPARVTPLLWEPLPTEDGRALVAYSDGNVHVVDVDELRRLLREFGQ